MECHSLENAVVYSKSVRFHRLPSNMIVRLDVDRFKLANMLSDQNPLAHMGKELKEVPNTIKFISRDHMDE